MKNYYPIAVDKTQLASEIEGLKLDATIEGRGMLKERVKSGLPILLEECSSVVQRSLRDTAAYAGLAAPIRDANRILNANVETENGIQKLKSGVLKEHWGRDAVNYVDYLLTDLQTKQRKRSDGIGRVMGKLRGNYAGAILTLNPGVAIAQAASLPTAGAVLGSDTLREKSLRQAAAGTGSGDQRPRRRAATIPTAGQPARGTGVHRRFGELCRKGHGQTAQERDRLDQLDGRDHGGGTVGSLKALRGTPRGRVCRRCGHQGQ